MPLESLKEFASRRPFFVLSCSLLLLFALPKIASAQDWSRFDEQGQLNYAETQSLISGRTLTFLGLGQSTYHMNGAYALTYEGQNLTKFGFFEVRRDGSVCVDFQDRTNRCDVFIKRRGLLFLVTGEGRRFPVFFEIEVK